MQLHLNLYQMSDSQDHTDEVDCLDRIERPSYQYDLDDRLLIKPFLYRSNSSSYLTFVVHYYNEFVACSIGSQNYLQQDIQRLQDIQQSFKTYER